MNCFIGLDIGTSSVKAVIVSADGSILATSSRIFKYIDSGKERRLPPCEFIEACYSAICDVTERIQNKACVKAICTCCASGSLLFLDRKNQPLTDIIGWQTSIDDADYEGFYTNEEKSAIYKRVGWPVLNAFPVAYLPWVQKRRPELLAKTGMLCMAAEYLNYTLTGKWGISPSMGTPFYLMDQEKGEYCLSFLQKVGLCSDMLPTIYEKGTVLGTIRPELADKLHLGSNVQVVLGGFDHPSGATGAGVYEEGDVMIACGTSWVEFFPVKDRATAIATGFLVDRYMLDGNQYCVMNSLTSFSERIGVYRNHYFGSISNKDFDNLTASSSLGCNGLVLDLRSNDYPCCDAYTKADIARAIMESAARLLKLNLEDATNKGLKCQNVKIVGGLTNADICMQIIADILDRPVSVVNGESAGAVGAAMLAGIGCGVYKNEKDAFNQMNFTVRAY